MSPAMFLSSSSPMKILSRVLLLYLFSSYLYSIASASPNPLPSNLTLGSSLTASADGPSYLLSPSGTFAFGFKSLGANTDQYRIGTWIANSSDKTFTWVPSPDHDEPIDQGSSIQLNNSGVFTLRKLGFKEEPLFDLTGPAFSASIQDNGNFVVFDNNSNIIRQSFDFPTDTIVEGQTLKSGDFLSTGVPPVYRVRMTAEGNLFLERNTWDYWYTDDGEYRTGYAWRLNWDSETANKGSRIVLKLDKDGHLYLADQNLKVIKNFTKGEEEQVATRTIYRATIDSDRIFRLYGERIGSEEDRKSVVLLKVPCLSCIKKKELITNVVIGISSIGGVIGALAIFIFIFYLCLRCC